MDNKQYLALDIGKAKTGIARASAVARIPQPVITVATGKLIDELKSLIRREPTEAIVVGLPRSLEGHDTKQTEWVRQWIKKAKEDFDMPFYFQDEALTSKIAEAKAISHKRPQDADAFAAAIILQDFLDTPEAERSIA